MKKLRRWLKKNRYYIIGFVLISTIGIMATIGATASKNNNEEVVVIPTEEPIIETPVPTPTDTYNPLPTYTPIPTCVACANRTPTPTTPFPWDTPTATIPAGTTPTATPITGTPTPYECDINVDGIINRSDIMLMIWAMGGTWTPTDVGFSNADINDDGEINYLDCNYCIKIVEHWID